MLMVGLMGRAIQSAYGNKYIYWLYGLGAVFGGLSSSLFQRPSPYVQPQVGAESVVAAYLTFLGLLNPHQTFMLFFFPVRAWVLLMAMGTYSLVFDPQKKIFSGMTAGLTVYQMMRVGFI
jgi:membrane associated rhomboid family serine protease